MQDLGLVSFVLLRWVFTEIITKYNTESCNFKQKGKTRTENRLTSVTETQKLRFSDKFISFPAAIDSRGLIDCSGVGVASLYENLGGPDPSFARFPSYGTR